MPDPLRVFRVTSLLVLCSALVHFDCLAAPKLPPPQDHRHLLEATARGKALFLEATPPLGAPARTISVHQTLKYAIQYLEVEHYDDFSCGRIAREAITTDPNSALARYFYGLCLLGDNKRAEAEEQLGLAAGIDARFQPMVSDVLLAAPVAKVVQPAEGPAPATAQTRQGRGKDVRKGKPEGAAELAPAELVLGDYHCSHTFPFGGIMTWGTIRVNRNGSYSHEGYGGRYSYDAGARRLVWLSGPLKDAVAVTEYHFKGQDSTIVVQAGEGASRTWWTCGHSSN